MVTRPAASGGKVATLDVSAIRNDFPILDQEVNGRPLVYLDNAATSQKPLPVLDVLDRFYRRDNANVHRGIHELSVRSTEAYEAARSNVARFIGAADASELIFVRGTTEAINLVAASWGPANLREGDEVVLTVLEHHSNLVPWHLLAKRLRLRLRYLDIDDDGRLRVDQLRDLLTERTKLVAVTHVSNGLGTINPIPEIVEAAHDAGALVLVDGAQAVPHLRVDVQALGCDFYAFSGHKMCGPTGIGALWARREILDAMPPYQGGGEMIERVTLRGSTFKEPPHRFEAGTPNIAGAVGFGAAVDYLGRLGMDRVRAHEVELLEYALPHLQTVPGFRAFGPATERSAVISFTLGDLHAHDLAQVLDGHGIAVRAGHHCNQPLMDRLGVAATTRASFYVYNDRDDVDALREGLEAALEFFG